MDMKHPTTLFFFGIFIALFFVLQTSFSYFFYYLEQLQLFLFTKEYAQAILLQPGGIATYIGTFLIQFFSIPYVGALIIAALMTLISYQTRVVLKQISPTKEWPLFYLLPAVLLLSIHIEFNYFLQGTIAYSLALIGLQALFLFKKKGSLLIYAITTSTLLYIIGGSIAVLYTVCILAVQTIKNTKKAYLFILPVLFSLLLGYFAFRMTWFSSLKAAYLPDLYYHHSLIPPVRIYAAWIALPLLILLAGLLPGKVFKKKWTSLLSCSIQVIAILAFGYLFVFQNINKKSLKFQLLDYYAGQQNWDEIITRMQDDPEASTNLLYLNYINLALASKGELAEKFFEFKQQDIKGLFLPWNKSVNASIILSDIQFAIGNIAVSQEMAFEANQSIYYSMGPRPLKRLIQTNLIYGAYPVAEKYLAILANTWMYKDWAKRHKVFLYNDQAIENDPLLGEKRKCLIKDNTLAKINIVQDLINIAEANPSSSTAIEYLGLSYLLAKEMSNFQALIETYYGTPVLPQLPKSFQEAVFILSETNPEFWTRFNVPESMVTRFGEYKKTTLANKNNPSALPGLLNRSFGNTYWFYFMFK